MTPQPHSWKGCTHPDVGVAAATTPDIITFPTSTAVTQEVVKASLAPQLHIWVAGEETPIPNQECKEMSCVSRRAVLEGGLAAPGFLQGSPWLAAWSLLLRYKVHPS